MDVDPPKAEKLAASNVAQRSPRSEDDLMDAENPYASPRYTEPSVRTAPQTTSTPAQFPNLWRTGNKLIVHSDSLLPRCCPVCGEIADGPQRLYKAYWKSPWWSAPVAVAMVLLYVSGLHWWFKAPAFAVLCAVEWFIGRRVGKHGLVYYQFCQRHEQRRITTPWYATIAGIATVAVATSVALIAWKASGSNSAAHALLILIGLFGVLLTLWFASRATPRFTVHRIRGPYIWLSGVNRRLLDQVPEASVEQLAKLLKEPN